MGCCRKSIFAITVLGVAVIAVLVYKILEPAPVPKLNYDEYWGPGLDQSRAKDVSINPFTINVSDTVLNRLKKDLQTVELTESLEDSNFQYGFNSATLKQVIEFWRTKYDWRKREVFLNQYPHFKTNIQGLDVHFMHIKPKVKKNIKILPLMMIHGWPGSVREFYEIIPMLTTKKNGVDFVFELIIPSLPGYGFSQAASKQGLGAPQMAVVMRNLMNRLGFKHYYVQGGDWGSIISTHMSQLFPEEILGQHSNMCVVDTALTYILYYVGSFYPRLIANEGQEGMIYPLSEKLSEMMLEFGYLHLQATKPDTLGVALRDSPAGLAAYILEKFSSWTVPNARALPDGGLTLRYKYEDLLDNVMIYYVTDSVMTAMRLYAETFNKAHAELKWNRVPVTVPVACAKFPGEITYLTDCQLKEIFKNLIQSTDMPQGGHFAAFEEPKLLADDIWSAANKFQNLALDKLNKNVPL